MNIVLFIVSKTYALRTMHLTYFNNYANLYHLNLSLVTIFPADVNIFYKFYKLRINNYIWVLFLSFLYYTQNKKMGLLFCVYYIYRIER